MRRSRLYRIGGIGYTAVLALAVLVVALGALGVVLRLVAALGTNVPAPLANLAKALPGVSATVTADPTTQQVSSIAITA